MDGNNFSINEILISANFATVYGLIIDPHDDQLPVGLIAQLVECCPGSAEDRIRVSFRPECSALSFATKFEEKRTRI